MEKRNSDNPKIPMSATVASIVHTPPSKFDPQGMYTGKPMDENEQPKQDEDDL